MAPRCSDELKFKKLVPLDISYHISHGGAITFTTASFLGF